MTTTICYKLNTPIIYNKGTKWEKSCDTFLERYANFQTAQAEVDELNKTATDRVYFVDAQEPLDAQGD